MGTLPEALAGLRARRGWSQQRLADELGASRASVARWEGGTASPSPQQGLAIRALCRGDAWPPQPAFAAHGSRRARRGEALVEPDEPEVVRPRAQDPVLERLTSGNRFLTTPDATVASLVDRHRKAAATARKPPPSGMSAGKNTYTYDAHTYHTKVPPQGIAELVRHYLPDGGLVLDPFAGSGMTGVATSVLGSDCILNELSPAACFIASRFVSTFPASRLETALRRLLDELSQLRADLYTTACRECGRDTELLYTVWAYRVACPHCDCDFNLWDVCRRYGDTAREHRILTEFPCPGCGAALEKSALERTVAEPVEVAYKCCGSRRREQTHPPDREDLALIESLREQPRAARGWFPRTPLPDGVNLGQPKRHGLTTVDKFYTPRNLAATSHIWKTIHRFEDPDTASFLAWIFTSLYRRVTRFSEFRFWGGSGNTARLNVPYIFDEPNVFVSYARKAQTIVDHLATTAAGYTGRTAVVNGSATDLSWLPDDSVDLIFTDPPFGSNINYSEMNLLWESWLGRTTDTTEEAIVNRMQSKDLDDYRKLILRSLEESYRVLRPGHWLLLVFMNSSGRVWDALHSAIVEAGFVIVNADVFDKQHGTFKHFVSENTAGSDLVLHCLKPAKPDGPRRRSKARRHDIDDFLATLDPATYSQTYLHVARPAEVDTRRMYSEWVAEALTRGLEIMDFAAFRDLVNDWPERAVDPS